jgi:3-hydroxyisobutyrate dehydrogenase
MTNTAGVIGLGEIGSGVALCLARAGMLTAVYDTRKDAADGLDGVPALSASPAAVARQCDTIVVAVVTAQQTIDVLSGPEGILAAARPGLGVILVATVSLDDLARIRSLTDAAGVALIDSGVVGGLKARENGLVCLVGAEDDALARARPVFEGFARSVAHLGGPGAGMTGKIAFNAMFLGILKAGREGATLAAAAGVDVGALTAVVADRLMAVGGPMRFVSQPRSARSRRRIWMRR